MVLIILICILFSIGLLRLLLKTKSTFKENLMIFLFIDLFIDLIFSIRDFFDVD